MAETGILLAKCLLLAKGCEKWGTLSNLNFFGIRCASATSMMLA